MVLAPMSPVVPQVNEENERSIHDPRANLWTFCAYRKCTERINSSPKLPENDDLSKFPARRSLRRQVETAGLSGKYAVFLPGWGVSQLSADTDLFDNNIVRSEEFSTLRMEFECADRLLRSEVYHHRMFFALPEKKSFAPLPQSHHHVK